MNTPHIKTQKIAILTSIMILQTVNSDSLYGNMVGNEPQNFNPTANGHGFVTVQSASPLPKFTLNLGLFVNQAVNSLPHFKESKSELKRKKPQDRVVSSQVHAAFGLSDRFELGVAMPYVNEQIIKTDGEEQGKYTVSGNTGTNIAIKAGLWRGQSAGFAAIASTSINRTKNNPYVGEGAGPTYNFEIAYDKQFGAHLFALNLGHRWRESGDYIETDGNPIRPLKNQYIYSVGANFALTDTQSIIFETFAGSPSQKVPDSVVDRAEKSAEALLGYKHLIFNKSLALHIGGGTELIHGHASPDWRAYAGVNWSPSLKSSPKTVTEAKPAPVVPQAPIGPLGPIKAEEEITIGNILFEFNSSLLSIKGQNEQILKLPKHLMTPPVFEKLIITGHTDAVGSDDYNMKLSMRRAQAIKSWLVVQHNIDPKKIIIRGSGERFPIATNKTAQGRQLNRRVVFNISRGKVN